MFSIEIPHIEVPDKPFIDANRATVCHNFRNYIASWFLIHWHFSPAFDAVCYVICQEMNGLLELLFVLPPIKCTLQPNA